MEKDVIISVLACGGKMSCRKQAVEFENPPSIININSSTGASVGTGTAKGFRDLARDLKSNGSILAPLFRSQNIKPRRVCLISYLYGWSFIHEILKTEDYKHIDTIIVLEGLNTRSLNPWIRYANNGRLWMAQTEMPHKIASSKSTAKAITCNFINERIVDFPSVTDVALEKPISIYSKLENPKTKIFQEDPLIKTQSLVTRSVSCLQYKGKQVQDQTYIQQYVQPRLWKALKEQWKDPSGIVFNHYPTRPKSERCDRYSWY